MSLNEEENMNESEEQVPESPKMALNPKNPPCINVPAIDVVQIKRQSSFHGTSRSTKGLAKSSVRCLCSPTTHVGSFRCRHHRAPGMPSGGSVGSNLSLLGENKSNPIGGSNLNSGHSGFF